MPFSSTNGKYAVDRAVARFSKLPELTKAKVLDLGPGSGTYSDRYAGSLLKRPAHSWTGVEIWEPYVDKYQLKRKYDEVVVQDCVDYLKAQPDQSFGYCFVGDVLEHMTKERAIELMDHARRVALVVILSVPVVHYPQGEYDGNPYEAHVKDDWSMEEVQATFKGGHAYREHEIGTFVYYHVPLLSHHRPLNVKVGVYGICKNELEFVDRCLTSFINEADAVSILDTGSTDGTFELLQGYAKVFHQKEITVAQGWIDPWRFDDARNAALSYLSPDVDVCVSIDLDEELDPGWHKQLVDQVDQDLYQHGRPKDRYHHRFSSVWNWREVKLGAAPNASDHWHERIHTRHGFMWKLPVHEVLVKADGSEPTVGWLTYLRMTQRPDLTKPRSSYLPLLQQAITEPYHGWKTWSFYAGELWGAGDREGAIKAYQHALTLKDADVAFLNMQLARVYVQLKDQRKATYHGQLAVDAAPHVREYQVGLAELYRDLGQPKRAYEALLEAEKITARTSGYEYNEGCWGQGFEDMKVRLATAAGAQP